ncbi:bro [Peridroma alphabaculovirus]|uniref:Bro n=1 Tax=Peridroma alphabaculovirus TaxID=1346829 RepID=A0A068LKC2_9ABAC|nr:bro [Peridroma alphabaculovirus]AIE47819.1 bro [Peridroma alphabaculovirus]
MSLSKINFAEKTIDVFTVVAAGNEKWHQANPFAEALGYSNANKAIWNHVSKENHREYESLRNGGIDESSPALHPRTKFINKAGIFELINASEMPAAKKFKAWNSNDLLPTLCDEGQYNMVNDAPAEIVQGMNAVHAATNDGAEAPWLKDINDLKNIIVQKDQLLAVITEENKTLTSKLVIYADALVTANAGLIQANNMTNQLANRMADIAQDVIAKPSDPQLLHSLAVCALGNDQYAFVRPQKRSLKRSLDRLAVDEQDIVFRSDYVPNGVNVLNKVKESLPKKKYTARHNKITLLEDYSREELVDVIASTLTERQLAVVRNNKSKSLD